MSVLQARSVSKSYERQTVLQDISLALDKGKVHVLLGPSGSGKTTLLRILAGLLDVDSGSVLFDDAPIEGPEKRLVPGYEEIRLVHQDFQLKFKMTVAENIRYELLSYVKDYQQERIEFLLNLFRIQHLRDTDVSQLSGGERQRVAIARGLAHEPDVLLMDEPFSNLDLGTKSGLLSEIKHMAEETETAILLVTHDTRDAMEVGDTISVLHDGHLIRSGTPFEVYNDPQLEIVANLFGPFNVMPHKSYKALGIDSNAKKVGVWPEMIEFTEEGKKASVTQTTFMGHYWKNRVTVDKNSYLCFSSDKPTLSDIRIVGWFDL